MELPNSGETNFGRDALGQELQSENPSPRSETTENYGNYGSNSSSTVGPTNAGSKPTPTTTRPTGDQQPGHQFAFKIHQTLKQLNMAISNKFMASIIEEHFHYADQYATMLEKKIRIQLYLVQNIQQNSGRILSALAILAVIGKIIGFKTLVLILFGMYLIQLTQAKKPTTLQGLHNTLLYIRFRRNYNWLSTGFGEQKYNKMEAALTDAIIQLQQIATPPPPRLLKFQFSKPIMREFIASFMLL